MGLGDTSLIVTMRAIRVESALLPLMCARSQNTPVPPSKASHAYAASSQLGS